MDGDDTSVSVAAGRSKRQCPDKKGRHAALERLRLLKGGKNKYAVAEVQNVYDEVSEKEYSKQVQERQEDDWIIDDDGCGYVEDGREIFDDDIDDDAIFKKRPEKKNKSTKGHITKNSAGNMGTIKNMLLHMPTKKKKEKEVKLDEDDILGDIMSELHSTPEASLLKPKPTLLKKKTPKASTGVTRSHQNPFSIKPVTPVRPRDSTRLMTFGNVKEEPVVDPLPASKTTPMPKKLIPEAAIKQEPMDVDEPLSPTQNIGQFDCEDELDKSVAAALSEEMEIDAVLSQEAVMTNGHAKQEEECVERQPEKPTLTMFDKIPVATEDQLSSGWETIRGSMSEDSSDITTDVHIDSTQLPVVENKDGEQVLLLYWLDGYEDYFRHPGTVYLFGKVWIESAKTYTSCCVTVKNIERKIYIYPRDSRVNLKTGEDTGQEVGMVEVYQEFNSKVADRYKILQFKSRKVKKKYAFERTDVLDSSDYLEVKYSADYPALPSDLKGETFSYIFGTNTSSMEMLLLEQKIKGPGWIEVKCPQLASPAVSWCKVEAVAAKPEHIVPTSGPPPPPLVTLGLNMRTTVNPKTHQNEIVMIACLIQHKFHMDKAAPSPPFQQHFCAVTRPADEPWPFDHREAFVKYVAINIQKMDSERALLGFFLARIHKIDPDIVVGHDIFGFDLDVLLHRVNVNKIPHWSKLGRLKRGSMPTLKGRGSAEKSVMCGRLVCDVKLSAKELIRARSYDMSTLCQQVLRIGEKERQDFTVEEVKKCYSTSPGLLRLMSHTMQDTAYILRLMYELNVIPLALQITNIAGNIMARTLLGGRSERNEYLLLHAFYEKDYILPDKQYGKAKVKVNDDIDDEEEEKTEKKQKGRRKPAYAGGLVLEPKKGFYDKYILLMDFNSLYPSIIQEYNVCFTTVSRRLEDKSKNDDNYLPEVPGPDVQDGILPREIRKLVESRRQVKQLMKNADLLSDLKLQYDIRQKALKLTANSMYGCLGFTYSRFYAKPLAALVTAKGREILLQTKDLVQKMNLEVIYGDTDSIMINTNCTDYDQVFKLGNKVKAEVNKLYKLLELDIDGVFKYMLLLKKKKYAAVTISKLASGQFVTEQELKGLDIVRRDWSQLSAKAGKHILCHILSDQAPDERIENIHTHLEKLGADLVAGQVPLNLLVITKQLTKNPEDYPDKKSLPHVQVALRINSKGGKKIRQGDTVPYVICEDGSNLPAMQRAYHLDELKGNQNLKIDTKYYLSQQIHPVVSRLCDPIEGTDAARIAECLGLDPSGYRHVQKYQQDDDNTLGENSQMSDELKYRQCERFKFQCINSQCKQEIILDSVFTRSDDKIEFALSRCPNPSCNVAPTSYISSIQNRLTSAMRKHIQKYYTGWIICEDPGCSGRTRKLPLKFRRGFPICSTCEKGVMFMEYTDCQLYTQLCFYQHLFDVKKAKSSLSANETEYVNKIEMPEITARYLKLKEHVDKTLNQNAFSEVNLSKLFDGLFPKGLPNNLVIKTEKE